MARKSARVALNLAALNDVQKAVAFGLLDLGVHIAQDAAANVEYATDPHHIRDQWGVAIYVDGKKVGDSSADGTATAKPSEFRAPKGLSGVVGFGFPARFHEVGTSDTAAEPFLAPAAARAAGVAVEIVRAGTLPHLK